MSLAAAAAAADAVNRKNTHENKCKSLMLLMTFENTFTPLQIGMQTQIVVICNHEHRRAAGTEARENDKALSGLRQLLQHR